MNKLYGELATWWPLLSPLEEYADEAAFYWQQMAAAGFGRQASLLELGSGGGSNAFYLKQRVGSVTLVDLSPAMLAVSRAINSTCEHLEGDMRTIRLGRLFDIVFIHDAIDHLVTSADLQQALVTVFTHLRPGGSAFIVPDHLRDTFAPSTNHGGSDGEGRAIRFLEWTYDPDPAGSTYVTEYVYLLREGDRPARVESEQMVGGLFWQAEWLTWLREAGLNPRVVEVPDGREMFVAEKRE